MNERRSISKRRLAVAKSHFEKDLPECMDLPINYKEATMAALSMGRWATAWRDKLVFLYSDNKCTVSILNKLSCKSELVMNILRKNFWLMAKNNIHLKAVYIKGSDNVIADSVSRLHEGVSKLNEFRSLYNKWHYVHGNTDDAFSYVSLCNHMSIASLLALQDREQFRCQRWPWITSLQKCLPPR